MPATSPGTRRTLGAAHPGTARGRRRNYLSKRGRRAVARLREIGDGREYAGWITRAVGELRPTETGRSLLKAIGKLDKLVLTTNYDRLLEAAIPKARSVGWSGHAAYLDAIREQSVTPSRRQPAVIHLHGDVGDAQSIVLGNADYERLLGDELQKTLKEVLFITRTLVFVGCGEGLRTAASLRCCSSSTDSCLTRAPSTFS